MYNFDIKRLTPIIYVVSVLILLILIFKVLIFLLPFVIAAIIVRMLSPIINRMSNKNKFTKSIVLLSFYVFVFIIVSLILVKIFLEAYNLFSTLIKNQDYILAHVTHALDKYEKYVSKLPDYSENLIDELVSKVLKYFNGTILNLLNSSINMLKMLPRLVVFIIVTILSSFIIINDKNIIVKFLTEQFPYSWLKIGNKIKKDILRLVFNYLRAQCILITLCFIELLVGLNIISMYCKDVKYVLIVSIIIAAIDALPILGAGSVLIPWVLVEVFVVNNYILALSLLVLYIIIFLVRQYSEPKLISKGAGMHPLITLIAMYSGFKIFGVLGFLYGPIIAAIIRIVFSEEIKYGFFKYLINNRKEQNE